MIKLDRPTKVPAPLLSAAAKRERDRAEEWSYRQERSRRSKSKLVQQVGFKPAAGAIRSAAVRDALLQAQHGKCAFCETPLLTVTLPDVEWFRPSSSAVDASGISSLPHYAWLTVEWHNLHVSCSDCNRAKGRRFPLDGPRGVVGAPWSGLRSSERALLLDPFVDDPDAHLLFTSDGQVNSETLEGRATIDCFALNRANLVDARRAETTRAISAWRAGDVEGAVAPENPYAGARRHAIRRLAEEQSEDLDSVVDAGEHLVVSGVSIRKVTEAEQDAAVAAESEAARAQSEYSLEDPTPDPTYFATAKYIYAVEATNWKAVHHVRIDFPAGDSERAPWLTMLGENAAGKSTILQGVALALLGQRGRDSLELEPDEFIRNGTRSAEVKVWLTGIAEPCVLTARRGDGRFGGSADPKVLVLAYGATRLLPGSPRPQPTPSSGYIADVDNLFDPFVPMADANTWLLGLDDKQFQAAARALRELLNLEGTDALLRYRKAGEVRCRTLGAVVPLDRMSDGYQSVVATVCDVMAVLMSRWGDVSAAEGIVLLDELGAHLHPRWRMRIVESLRTVFPRVQFVVTTHDPLCLRGLGDGEVALVQRRADKAASVVVRQDLPPISGLRVDQLLTSELFGLHSTVDPALEAAFDEYYRLLAIRRPRRAQVRRIDELRTQLDGLRLLGDTHRERLVFEAADRWLATRPAGAERTSVREENDAAVTMLAEVWAVDFPDRFTDAGG